MQQAKTKQRCKKWIQTNSTGPHTGNEIEKPISPESVTERKDLEGESGKNGDYKMETETSYDQDFQADLEQLRGDETENPANKTSEELMTELSNTDLKSILQSKDAVCPCGQIITDNVMRSMHKSIHAASNSLKCSECNVVFDDYYKFQEHLFCKR